MYPSGWKEVEGKLCAEFVFTDFKEAFAFMMRVAEIAEAQSHHPEWMNVYNKVAISLSTHDEGNSITQKDIQLAKAISEVAEPNN